MGRVSVRALAAAAGKGYWRKADARQVVRAWRASGEALSTFAARHGVKAARLARWAGRLGRRGVGRRQPGRGEAEPLKLRFHPVELVGHSTALETRSIEVVLLDGRRVRVPSGFTSEDLERVLRVVEGASRC